MDRIDPEWDSHRDRNYQNRPDSDPPRDWLFHDFSCVPYNQRDFVWWRTWRPTPKLVVAVVVPEAPTSWNRSVRCDRFHNRCLGQNPICGFGLVRHEKFKKNPNILSKLKRQSSGILIRHQHNHRQKFKKHFLTFGLRPASGFAFCRFLFLSS